MSNRLWLMLAVTAVVALGAGVGIGAVAWAGGDHDSGGAMMGGSSTHEGATDMGDAGSMNGDMSEMDERTFMEMMVPHHQSAIEMAEMAIERAERPEVKRLARGIVAAQEGEIARMESWYPSWFGEKLVPDMSGPHANTDMSRLEAADDFDRAFLRMMIPHHSSAIMMADQVSMSEPRGEIQALADEIIAAQSREVGEMQRWREQWYPPRG